MALANNTEYFSGQGKLFIAPLKQGVPVMAKLRWVGNVPELSISTEVDKVEHKESHSGQRSVDKTIVKEVKTGFKAALEEFTKDNLVLALRSSSTAVAGATVAEEVGAAEIADGDSWVLAHQQVSELSITDSTTATAKKLVEHTDYEVDEQFGRITLLKTTGFKAPLKAAYTHSGAEVLDLMQEAPEGHYLRFEGLNTAEGNAPVLVEMFKADIDPAKTLDLIQDDLAKLELEGNILRHNNRTVRITRLKAA